MRGLSLVAASGGYSSSRCAGLSLSWPLLLWSAGSVVVAHGPSCSAACGIFPDHGSNPCPLHWQADSQPLRHQGSPSGCCFYIHAVTCRLATPFQNSVPLWFFNLVTRKVHFCLLNLGNPDSSIQFGVNFLLF